jgi:hypothetical protein
VVERVETPRERRERYLRDAEEFERIANNLKNGSAKDRYRKLAAESRTMADEVWGLQDRDRA